jgi:formylglycine-generating enzyme required for sulfatase activity
LILFLLASIHGCGSDKQATTTTITIESSPEQGASVMIGGVVLGDTPITIPDIPVGLTDVLLKKENYKRTADRIQISGGPPENFIIELEPLTGLVTFETKPTGAFVFIDSKPFGRTPILKGKVPVGNHQYEFQMDNYYPVDEEIEIKADFVYSYSQKLKPIEATLFVKSRPSGATIWINSQRQDKRTPASFRLDPADYLVDVHSDGYVQQGKKTSLQPADNQELSFQLIPGQVPPGMVLIPSGPFTRGEDKRAPDESPQSEIHLDAYYIDKTEVTNEQYQKVFPDHQFTAGMEEYPVTGISWSQALKYARMIGKRLPTEAEWEKAARGPEPREFPWGNDFDPEAANTRERQAQQAVPCGKLLKGISPYGCLDMAGNVYEWTADWYQAYPGNTVVTKDYGQRYRVLRGGSFTTPKFDVRCASRHFDEMDKAQSDYGMRCAMDVSP